MSGFGQDYRDEIRNMAGLLAEGREEEALSGLDNMNWRKIHNISAIVQASELYEACGRVEDAKDLLLMAHEKSPMGRVVLYHLCLLCVRRSEYEEAKKYYEDYIEIAPHDFQKFVLKYYLAKAREADEYTLIAILEELKENEFVDEWAYQLAYLYNKTGQVDKCMSLCDEIALYYGDGPYVEKALELKMLYHPLNDEQERQYRRIRGLQKEEDQEKDGAEQEYHPIKDKIPVPEAAPGKFDTVNLQAEIRKNIDEIMQATEAGEVDETLENIENLVGELPYVKMDDYEEKVDENEKKNGENSIMEHYQKYLDEEYDGQMSIAIPDINISDPQIEGQMTIQDVMNNWEKTKRAAEAALSDADKAKFEKTKEVALEKANRIMTRLEKATPMLDAGTNPHELMKEEILHKDSDDNYATTGDSENINTADLGKAIISESAIVGAGAIAAATAIAAETVRKAAEIGAEKESVGAEIAEAGAKALVADTEESTKNPAFTEPMEPKTEAWKTGITFSIPKIKKTGDVSGVGLEIPVVDEKGNSEGKGKEKYNKSIDNEMKSWEPPHLDSSETHPESGDIDNGNEQKKDKVSYLNATKIMEGVNDMLQQEIERFAGKDENEVPQIKKDTKMLLDDDKFEDEAGQDLNDDKSQEYTSEVRDTSDAQKQIEDDNLETQKLSETEKAENSDAYTEVCGEDDLMQLHISGEKEENSDIQSEIPDDEYILAETLVSQDMAKKQLRKMTEEDKNKEKTRIDLDKTVVLEQLGDEIKNVYNQEIEEDTEGISDNCDEPDDIYEDCQHREIADLTDEERELFSYFLPVPNMKKTICGVLTNVKDRLDRNEGPTSGNIAIAGGHGSGKTTMAKAIIMTLQTEMDKPGNNIGRIDAEKLNDKNFQGIYERIKGGCLVIEQAGDLNKETAISLSLLMNNDNDGTLIILEDTKAGINRAIGLDGNFGKKFTERIDIPVFTVDELVNFGQKYAKDEGYTVDEMGKLAMYDRITKEQRGDRPMYLRDVIEIMDEAIEKASSKGFFHRRKVDDEGKPILVEKDFF